MKKTILSSALLALCLVQASAGGLLTNTNQSAHFLRNPARGASTEIDAAYTNPAGLTFLADGFHLAFSNQSAFQKRTVTSTFAPFAGFGGEATKVFEGTVNSPIIPNLQAAYKQGRWVISANIGVYGGGGKAEFDQGLPSFEAPVAMIPLSLSKAGVPGVTKYSLESKMKGSSIIYGAQFGGSYAISDMFSMYTGFRVNIVNNGYDGYLRNIKINPFGGEMKSAVDVFKSLGLDPSKVADMDVDVSQSGWGVAPIVGLNFNKGKWNVGVKYEFLSWVKVKNETRADGTGMFPNGRNTPSDIPAMLSVGASYKILPQLTASAEYHHYFDSKARMDGGKQRYIDGGMSEYLGGLEYQINKLFLVSSGFQISRQGIADDNFQKDLSHNLNSYSIGLGGAVNVSESVRINLGYFWTVYSDWTKKMDNYAGFPVPGTDVFSRTNKVFGAGVDLSF